MNKIIEKLNHRYATKEFDVLKSVSKEDLDTIIETFRLTPSSFGLEPWNLVIVENKDIKESLVEHSWGQRQISDNSHLLVLSRVKDLDDKMVNKFLDNNSSITWASREDLKWYEDMMKWFLSRMNENEKIIWANKQVYIALWNVINSLAQLWIDSCPVEWFNPEKYDEILDLEEKWLKSVVVLPIGYRSENDKYAKSPKVRYKTEEILTII